MFLLRPYILLIVVQFLAAVAGAQYEKAFNTSYPQRFPVIDSIFKERIGNRDSATIVREIDVLRKAAQENDDEKAALLADCYRFLWFYYSPWMTEEKAQLIVDPVLVRLNKIDFPELRAFIVLHLGYFYFKGLRKTGTGLYNLLHAHDLYMKLSNEGFPWKGVCLSSLAEIFYKFGDYKKTIQFGSDAEHFPLGKFQALRHLDMLGMAYLKSGSHDSALLYFDKCLSLIKDTSGEHIPRGWDGILAGNKGHVYYKKGQHEKAIPFYRQGIDITARTNLWDNTCGFATSLGSIYLRDGKMDSVASLLLLARNATYRGGNEENYFDLYTLLAAYYKKEGNCTAALLFTDSSAAYKDSLTKRLSYRIEAEAELSFETEKRKAGEKLLHAEIQNQRLFRWGALVVVAFIIIIALLTYNRQSLKLKLQRQQAQAEKQKAEEELAFAKARLTEFAHNISEKNKLLENLQQRSEGELNSEEIRQLQQYTILTDEEWNRFRDMFEKVHGGYLHRLKEKLSGLSPAETRFMALAKLGLSNKEMAASLGIGTPAIRTTWSRLRKKLNLPEEGSLQELVDQV